MREWRVAGGLVQSSDGLLLVRNHRQGGRVDWTPPGGVVDEGESIIEGLTREVEEETGLVVTTWSGPVYVVQALAVDMEWHLRAEIYLADSFQGEVAVGDDPDGIVREARFVEHDAVADLVTFGPRWVHEPLLEWVGCGESCRETYRYHVHGTSPASYEVRRVDEAGFGT